jgi:hypothetical protein
VVSICTSQSTNFATTPAYNLAKVKEPQLAHLKIKRQTSL